jgi:poly-gamma-glutamate synthesis protein (capsule biosynthesis protein)
MKIALLGDVAPFGRYCLHRNPEALAQFDEVATLLRSHDVVIGNLETPFAEGEKATGSKSAHIHAHPDNVRLLQHLGITHVTLGNNHIADYGVGGYERTKAILSQAGIEWFGAENRVLRIEAQGEKISLIGYCSMNTNPAQIKLGGANVPNLLDVDVVLQELARSTQDGYFPVLSVHSGQEHVHMPSSEDVAFARALALRYDHVYYGHHPHVVQGAEKRGNSLALYSLGNFVFDDVFTPREPGKPLIELSEANKTGAVASIEIVNGQIRGWDVTPIYLGETRVRVGQEVEGFDLDGYSESLGAAGTEAYDAERREIILEYIDGRRARRNFRWYLRRLNLNSVGIIFAARRNARMHRQIFASKLDKMGDPK